ncbi:hypothetical protein GOBAR_AA21056 [Gossypium barbadense]|uniref:Uncharacterized protein n=1 Tax=Gossypium barbadense TaxID=3634 RepID=A0A2P5X8H3_GOSBA|nr:hypothetical protein GOBAR_AA21056 [Gossypium barbadense]
MMEELTSRSEIRKELERERRRLRDRQRRQSMSLEEKEKHLARRRRNYQLRRQRAEMARLNPPMSPIQLPLSLDIPAHKLAILPGKVRLNRIKHLARAINDPVGDGVSIGGLMKENGTSNCLSSKGLRLNRIKRLARTTNPAVQEILSQSHQSITEAFNEQEIEIVRRLYLVSLETQQHLVFRLLSVHWLMVFLNRLMVEKKKSIVETGFMFYPSVFDPLSLKALKLDLLAFCSVCIDKLNPQSVSDMEGNSVVKLFQDGLVSVLGFKWLPPWSTETAVAFRTFHKFLIGASSHSEADPSTTTALMESAIFNHLKEWINQDVEKKDDSQGR